MSAQEAVEHNKRAVRSRASDTAATARNALNSELFHYASYFTGEERKALVAVIQSLEKFMRKLG